MTPSSAPPFDPELRGALEGLRALIPASVTPEVISLMRQAPSPSLDELLSGRPIQHQKARVPVDGGSVEVSIFARHDHVAGSPAIFYTHGGGMIFGDRFSGAEEYLGWVEDLDVVLVSVEYRLAPEFPDPTPINDCYAGLVWMSDQSDRLSFDSTRVVIAGSSAGGGLAAGVSLKARDLSGPPLAGSLLIYPMIDDRNDSISSQQIDGIGIWDRTSNQTGWDALLGPRRGAEGVSIYAAPARAEDLSGLPPTFIDCASAEVFRDEDVAYATRIWAQGGQAELHVWPGGFHGFDALAPHAAISIAAREARVRWLRRILGL